MEYGTKEEVAFAPDDNLEQRLVKIRSCKKALCDRIRGGFSVFLTRPGHDDIIVDVCGPEDLMYAHGVAVKAWR